MTHYSENPGHVRFDFFKPESGRWYMTEMIDMSDDYNAPTVYAAVRDALSRTRHGRHAEKRWLIVILTPYHESAYPISLSPGRAEYTDYPPSSAQAQLSHGEVSADGRMSGIDWAVSYNIRIRTPTGWTSLGRNLIEPLEQEEFLLMASTSTLGGDGLANFTDELTAWADRK